MTVDKAKVNSDMLHVYVKAVNQIDDVCEYRYRNMTNEELAKYVRDVLKTIVPNLIKVREKHGLQAKG